MREIVKEVSGYVGTTSTPTYTPTWEEEILEERCGATEPKAVDMGTSVGTGQGHLEVSADSMPLNRLAPYERRVIELLRNSKDKRARKLAKKRVRSTSTTQSIHIPGTDQLACFRESNWLTNLI